MTAPRPAAIALMGLLPVVLMTLGACQSTRAATRDDPAPSTPYVVVLGTAQDAGSPQINSPADHPARLDPSERRLAICLGIVDPASGQRWIIDATPDFREQAWMLSRAHPESPDPIQIDGVFLTHAHMGHYTGLMFLGYESMGARGVHVHAMPRMAEFLRTNGPWEQLVSDKNIDLRPLAHDTPVGLGEGLSITPFLVPHRQEYSEVVGFRIDGPSRSALFLPDIDSWDEWAAGEAPANRSGWTGTPVEIRDAIADVDIAYLDATFYDNHEIPGRDMSGFPHPRIVETMERLAGLPASERAKVRFVHLNHTNPAQWLGTPERRAIERAGFGVASRGELFGL